MADDVKLVFTGNSADAEKAIAQLERKFDSLEQKMKRGRATSKQIAVETKTDFDNMGLALVSAGAKWGPLIAGATAYAGVLTKIGQANSDAFKAVDQFAGKHLEQLAKFQVQTGLNAPQAAAAQDVISKKLMATPITDLTTAVGMGQQLASSGIKKEDIDSGAALDVMLKFQAGSAAIGKEIKDPMEFVKPAIQMLKANGVAEPGAKELLDVADSFVGVYGTSDIQMPDLSFIARKAGVLKQFGLSMDEQLATGAALVDVHGGEKAATGLSGYVTRMSTAANVKERTEALAGIGLTPDDIAMAKGGQGFFQATDKLRGALKDLPQQKRNEFMNKFFGEEAAPAAAYFTSDEGFAKSQDYVKRASDNTVFNKNVANFQSTRFAEQKRVELKKDDALRKSLEVTPMTWGEAWQQEEAARTKLHAMASEKLGGGMAGGLAHSAISAWSLAGQAVMKGMEFAGMEPTDVGFRGTNRQQGALWSRELRQQGDLQALDRAAGFGAQLTDYRSRFQKRNEVPDQQTAPQQQGDTEMKQLMREQNKLLQRQTNLMEQQNRKLPPARAMAAEGK